MEDAPEEGSTEEDEIAASRSTKRFKFMTKFNRPFIEGSGPKDIGLISNYNQKLRGFIQDELDMCKVDRKDHGIDVVSGNVEKYFKDNLIRRFDQIQALKQRVAQQQMNSIVKMEQNKSLIDKF